MIYLIYMYYRRSAHERLFGTKPNTANESTDQNANESGNFNKVGSLDRSQNSKSVLLLLSLLKNKNVLTIIFRIHCQVTIHLINSSLIE